MNQTRSLRHDIVCTLLATAAGSVSVGIYGLVLGNGYSLKELSIGLPLQFCVFMAICTPITLLAVTPTVRFITRRHKDSRSLTFLSAFLSAAIALIAVAAFISQAKNLNQWVVPIVIGTSVGAFLLALCRHRRVA